MNTNLVEVITKFLSNFAALLNVLKPGEVVSYDVESHRADVKLLLKPQFDNDEDDTELPIIAACPVVQMRTENGGLHVPVKPGDKVALFFSDLSIDTWLYAGTTGKVDDVRMHALSDAIAIVGLYPLSTITCDDNDALRIDWAGCSILLTDDKDVKIDASRDVRINASGVVNIDAGTRVQLNGYSYSIPRFEKLLTKFNAHSHSSWGAPPSVLLDASDANGTVKIG